MQNPQTVSGEARRHHRSNRRRHVFLFLTAIGCHSHWVEAAPSAKIATDEGMASFYGDRFEGRRTASGEPYRSKAYTAVHPSLPFGTRLRVTNLANSRTVEVRVNDRCARQNRRILDLSKRAAKDLGMLQSGVARVRIDVIAKEFDD